MSVELFTGGTPVGSPLSDPYADWTTRYPGRRAMGYLCTYVPEEIIHAAGFVAIRLAPTTTPPTRADAHLQSYTCCLARSCLNQALSQKLDWLAGVVFAHTGDTMQGLADIWREALPDMFVETVVSPVVLNSPHAKPYLVAELERFRQTMANHVGASISDESIRESIRLYNARRRALAEFYARRDEFKATQWSAVMNGTLLSPPEAPLDLPIGEGAVSRPPSPLRIALVGSTLDEPTLPNILDERGAQVVADDFCNGGRYFDTLVDEAASPLQALADRELTRIPCPCKHKGLNERADHVLELVKRHHAQGVILINKKFCDPHAWDFVPIASALDRAHIPYLSLETEQVTPLGQTRVRVEAFMEMLCD